MLCQMYWTILEFRMRAFVPFVEHWSDYITVEISVDIVDTAGFDQAHFDIAISVNIWGLTNNYS